MFNKAVEWDLVEKSPFEGKKTLRIKENNRRLRYLTEKEIERLMSASPPHVRDFVEVALHTGMRLSELLGLKWRDIAGRFIYLTKTKTDEPRQIPVNETLDKVFKRIRQKQWRNEIQSDYVFLYQGKNFKSIRKGFVAALKRAGITDFRVHDLRHTFASHYMMRKGSLGALQKILGHKDIQMTMRYAHLSSEFARQEIENLNDLTKLNVKLMSNFGSEKNERLASV
jgi:integrase